jgi:hypothetical protein
MEDTQLSRHRRRRLHLSSNTLVSLHTLSNRLAVQYNSRKEDIRIAVLLRRERLRSHRPMLANTSSRRRTIRSTTPSHLSHRRARYRSTTLRIMRA